MFPRLNPIPIPILGYSPPSGIVRGPCYARIEGTGFATALRYEIYDETRPELVLRIEEDDGDDGRLEAYYDYTYDAAGNLTSRLADTQGNGAVDFTERWTYDDDGNTLTYERDEDADGTPEFREERTYDELGRESTFAEDADGDGVWDFRRTSIYGEGDLRTFTHEDRDLDGTTDVIISFTYDERDRVTRSEGREVETDALTYLWLAEFSPLEVEGVPGAERFLLRIDDDGDGVVDRTYDYVIYANGNLRDAVIDEDGDGLFETEYREQTFDEVGRAVSWTYVSIDFDQGTQFHYDVARDYLLDDGPWRTQWGYFRTGSSLEDGEIFVADEYRETYEWNCPALVP